MWKWNKTNFWIKSVWPGNLTWSVTRRVAKSVVIIIYLLSIFGWKSFIRGKMNLYKCTYICICMQAVPARGTRKIRGETFSFSPYFDVCHMHITFRRHWPLPVSAAAKNYRLCCLNTIHLSGKFNYQKSHSGQTRSEWSSRMPHLELISSDRRFNILSLLPSIDIRWNIYMSWRFTTHRGM